MDAQTADNWALVILIGAPIAAYVIARVFALRSLPTLALGVMLAAAGGFVIDGYLLQPGDLPYSFGLVALQVPLSAIAAFVVWRVRAKSAPAIRPEPVSSALASANRRILARCVDAMVGFVRWLRAYLAFRRTRGEQPLQRHPRCRCNDASRRSLHQALGWHARQGFARSASRVHRWESD